MPLLMHAPLLQNVSDTPCTRIFFAAEAQSVCFSGSSAARRRIRLIEHRRKTAGFLPVFVPPAHWPAACASSSGVRSVFGGSAQQGAGLLQPEADILAEVCPAQTSPATASTISLSGSSTGSCAAGALQGNPLCTVRFQKNRVRLCHPAGQGLLRRQGGQLALLCRDTGHGICALPPRGTARAASSAA